VIVAGGALKRSAVKIRFDHRHGRGASENMCGICGIVGWNDGAAFDEGLLRRMSAVLAHRGPDDRGTYLCDAGAPRRPLRVGLGHARLSIIDLAGGHQPLANEDGTIHVVYNGEVYNFPEIRERLIRSGHVFRTRTDTEVIVHLYEERGVACLGELRGMFAFALWDRPKRRLFLARDRLGQKPLAYYQDRERFIFGSEIKAILEVPGVPRKVNAEAVHHYLTYQYVPHPLSMFQGMAKLPPAHYMVLEFDPSRRHVMRASQPQQYWQPRFRVESRLRWRDYAARVREHLTEAVRLRLISDVPLGAFLSGGIDSTVVVGLMSRLMKEPVKTFSIGFAEKRYDEVRYARMAANAFRTDHREFTVRPKALDVIPKLVWHYDEPFADSSAIPTYYVSQMTSEHVKVALTGDGGDECFAGYPRYKAVRLSALFDALPRGIRRGLSATLWKRLPAPVQSKTLRRRARRFLEAMALSPEARYLRWCCIFDDERKYALYSAGMRARFRDIPSSAIFSDEYSKCRGPDFLARTMFVDMRRYLPDDLLVKVDVASMAHSLEARSPFLDHRLIEFVAGVPTDLKLRGLRSKYLLKRAFADLLPGPIRRRRKMGFGVPIAEWFRGELKGFVRDILLDRACLERGYFEPAAVRHLVDEHTQGRFDHGYRLWSLLMLELWHQRFIDRHS